MKSLSLALRHLGRFAWYPQSLNARSLLDPDNGEQLHSIKHQSIVTLTESISQSIAIMDNFKLIENLIRDSKRFSWEKIRNSEFTMTKEKGIVALFRSLIHIPLVKLDSFRFYSYQISSLHSFIKRNNIWGRSLSRMPPPDKTSEFSKTGNYLQNILSRTEMQQNWSILIAWNLNFDNFYECYSCRLKLSQIFRQNNPWERRECIRTCRNADEFREGAYQIRFSPPPSLPPIL